MYNYKGVVYPFLYNIQISGWELSLRIKHREVSCARKQDFQSEGNSIAVKAPRNIIVYCNKSTFIRGKTKNEKTFIRVCKKIS